MKSEIRLQKHTLKNELFSMFFHVCTCYHHVVFIEKLIAS